MVEEENESWFANGLHRFIIVFSVMWFAIVAVYISKFFGWDKLFSMLPNEFSGFMAGITLPLAIVWVIMAYIDRGSNFKNETRMLRDSLNQVIFPDSNGNEASKLIAAAIKEQVSDLKETTRDVCAQSDVIKRELTDRVTEMRSLTEALDKYSSQALLELNDEIKKLIENFNLVTEKASSTMADFRVNTMQMREDGEKIVGLLTPMVNEMVTAAERVKEVVNVNNENIAKAQEQLNQYSQTSQTSISKMIESWAAKGENLEQTYLRASENCEELFRRLDSGISHIENSIKEQKQVVETQSGLIDKNSAYLDNKLGEYGRLISLEVEAMVERSGTLEQNVQTQLKSIRETSDQVAEALKAVYPNEYHNPDSLKYDAGHYYFGDVECSLNMATPYGPTLSLPCDSLRPEWERVNVAFMLKQADTLHQANLVVQVEGNDGGTEMDYYPVKTQIMKIGRWDFATYDLPIDSVIRTGRQVKMFVCNPSESSVQLKCMDVSFRPAYLMPRVKGKPMGPE